MLVHHCKVVANWARSWVEMKIAILHDSDTSQRIPRAPTKPPFRGETQECRWLIMVCMSIRSNSWCVTKKFELPDPPMRKPSNVMLPGMTCYGTEMMVSQSDWLATNMLLYKFGDFRQICQNFSPTPKFDIPSLADFGVWILHPARSTIHLARGGCLITGSGGFCVSRDLLVIRCGLPTREWWRFEP